MSTVPTDDAFDVARLRVWRFVAGALAAPEAFFVALFLTELFLTELFRTELFWTELFWVELFCAVLLWAVAEASFSLSSPAGVSFTGLLSLTAAYPPPSPFAHLSVRR